MFWELTFPCRDPFAGVLGELESEDRENDDDYPCGMSDDYHRSVIVSVIVT